MKKNIYHSNTNQKKVEVAILTLDKIDFRAKNIIRGKKSHFTIIKESIHQENIPVLNIYATNNRSIKYIKQKLID